MGEEVAQGDPLLAMDAELGDVLRYRIVQLQLVPLPELGDGNRPHGFGGGEPEHQVVAGERLAGPVLAHGAVSPDFAVEGDVDLGSEVEPFTDPLLDRLPGSGERLQRSVQGVGHGGGL